MPAKLLSVPDVGEVAFYKRRGAKSIRLKVDERGKPSVTMPVFMPYAMAVQFVRKNADWLHTQTSVQTVDLVEGMRIGRVHLLRFVFDGGVKQPQARVTASQIVVRYSTATDDPAVQEAAKRAATRALRREAEHFLPKRLADLAAAHGYDYSGVSIKQLRGRWGSCDQRKHITFNLYLMQLPIECIDYVIFHELAHTRAMHHGADFWRELEAHLPHAKRMRKYMKRFQPTVPAIRPASHE